MHYLSFRRTAEMHYRMGQSAKVLLTGVRIHLIFILVFLADHQIRPGGFLDQISHRIQSALH